MEDLDFIDKHVLGCEFFFKTEQKIGHYHVVKFCVKLTLLRQI